MTIAHLTLKLTLLSKGVDVMDVLEYSSGFDFVDMMREFDYEYVKFMGGRAMVLTC